MLIALRVLHCTRQGISNNEWNKRVGESWRALSTTEQLPYKRRAEEDKCRYESVRAAFLV
jgi:hypothetical protein